MLKPRPAPPDLTGHACAIPGCRAFGSFGFGPPGLTATVRWYCSAHEEEGRRQWLQSQATGPAPVSTPPRQGGLF